MANKKQTVITRPVARSERLLVETVGDETVIYDQDAHVAHALKPLAAVVFMYANGENTAAEIAELTSYRLGAAVTEAEVDEAVRQLSSLDLLETRALERSGGVSRRDALKVFGAVGAGTALISSVAAPTAFAASNQTPAGDSYWCAKNGADLLTDPGDNDTGYPQPTAWNSNGSPALELGFQVAPGGACAYNTSSSSNKTCQTLSAPTSESACTFFGGTWSDSQCTSYQPVATLSSGSCPSGTQVSKTMLGYWQCVPCDGSDGYQCCSVVCAPARTGYAWGVDASKTFANVLTLPSGWYPYVGCGYTGSGTNSYTACANGTDQGTPDYTNAGYKAKYCTYNECGAHGGVGCTS